MEYRTKAAVVFAVIFCVIVLTVSMIYLGVKGMQTDGAGSSFDGGVMVEAVTNQGTDML